MTTVWEFLRWLTIVIIVVVIVFGVYSVMRDAIATAIDRWEDVSWAWKLTLLMLVLGLLALVIGSAYLLIAFPH